jgi:hypothetical protein
MRPLATAPRRPRAATIQLQRMVLFHLVAFLLLRQLLREASTEIEALIMRPRSSRTPASRPSIDQALSPTLPVFVHSNRNSRKWNSPCECSLSMTMLPMQS